MEAGSIRRPDSTWKLALMVGLGQEATPPAVGRTDWTDTLTGAMAGAVEKVQTYLLAPGRTAWLLASALPARSVAPVVMVAV